MFCHVAIFFPQGSGRRNNIGADASCGPPRQGDVKATARQRRVTCTAPTRKHANKKNGMAAMVYGFGGGLISSDPAAAADALSSESERNVGSSATAALLIGENEKCAAWEGQRGEATAVVEPVR